VRMGLHTGEPVSGSGDYAGLDVHRAARICAVGHGGQIILTDAVSVLAARDLPSGVSLRDLGSHRLKDLRDPEHLFQVVHADLTADFPPLKSLNARPNNLPIQSTPNPRALPAPGRNRDVGSEHRPLLPLVAASPRHTAGLFPKAGIAPPRLVFPLSATDLMASPWPSNSRRHA